MNRGTWFEKIYVNFDFYWQSRGAFSYSRYHDIFGLEAPVWYLSTLIYQHCYFGNITAWKVSVFGVFLFGIFPHSDWIRRDTPYFFIFNPNAGIYGQIRKTQTLFKQCISELSLRLEITRLFGSSLRRCSVRKGVLRKFKKFTGKRLCQSLLFNKAAGCAKLLRTPFLTKHPQATTYEYLIL